MQNSNSFPPSNPITNTRRGSKVVEVKQKLKQLMEKQQRSFRFPHKPIKLEGESPRDEIPTKEARSPPPSEGQATASQLTRNNMEIFQQQQRKREKENLNLNQNHQTPAMTQLDGNRKLFLHKDIREIEVDKLRHTIATYESNTNNLMRTLAAERESYKAATRDLQRANEALKNDVARIERSFREVLNKREDEVQMNERFRRENEELLNKNLRLQHDLNHAMATIDKTDLLLVDMKVRMDKRNEEKERLAQQNTDLCQQLERLRSTMSAWTANTDTAPDKSLGTTVTCAVSKIVFFGSIIAVGLAAVLQVVQASPQLDCDYVRESLPD